MAKDWFSPEKRAQINSVINKMDRSIKHRSQCRERYNLRLRAINPDFRELKKRNVYAISKLVNSIEKITLIRVLFRIQKDRASFLKVYNSSIFIRQVLKNDQYFMK